MRPAAASISSAGAASWSSWPSVAATPPLVVATTGKPAETTARAVATSQAFGSRSGAPGRCSDRSRSHRLSRSMAGEVVMWRTYADIGDHASARLDAAAHARITRRELPLRRRRRGFDRPGNLPDGRDLED